MLPDLGALALRARRAAPTGEFIKLSRAEARQLNNSGELEPINQSKYMPSDCDPGEEERFGDDYECFEPFKVWARDPATGRPSRHYKIYNARVLWDALGFMDQLRDPIFRQPVWREDWWELHQKYDSDGAVPRKVRTLPRKDKDDGDSDTEDEDAYEVEEEEETNEVFCRFWLKGPTNIYAMSGMESYFNQHFKAFVGQHVGFRLVTGIVYSDISNFEIDLDPGDLTRVEETPMPFWNVDVRITFESSDKAAVFWSWSDTVLQTHTWGWLVEHVFGVSPIFDTDETPFHFQPENGANHYGHYRSAYLLPSVPWPAYQAQKDWELKQLYEFTPDAE
jgi:hypothetical protein